MAVTQELSERTGPSERDDAVRVVIVDDHRTLAELLAVSLRHEPGLELVVGG